MKEKELREIAECKICNKPFGHTQLPIFYRVSIQVFGLDIKAIQRQDGFAAPLGSNELVAVMGTDAEMATPISSSITSTVCHRCYMDSSVLTQLNEDN